MEGSSDKGRFFLVKLFSFNTIGVSLRTLIGLISQKIVAIYLGPSGVAILGNLRNLMGLVGMFSTTGIDQGVVTLQSKFSDTPKHLKELYKTFNFYALIGSLFTAVILLFGYKDLSEFIFGTQQYDYLLLVLALGLPFMAIYNVAIAVANGKSDYKRVTFITVFVHVAVSAGLIILVQRFDLKGALWAIVLTPLVQVISLFIFSRSQVISLIMAGIGLIKTISRQLFIFVIMSFSAVVLSNVVDLFLRNQLILKLSALDAGYWTSMTSVSNYYLSILAGFYSLYVLPRYAKVDTMSEFKREVWKIFKFIIPVFLLLFVVIYLLRDVLVILLFSKEFIPMTDLFKWQLLADLIKIIAVIIAFNLIAKQMWKLFIISEIFSSLLFYILGSYLIDNIGLEGVVIAHLLRYLLYLVLIVSTAQLPFNKAHKT